MHAALVAWLQRTGISLHEGCRLLRQRNVSWFDIYGDEPSSDFERGAAEIETALKEKPEVMLWWSSRDLWIPAAQSSDRTDAPAEQKTFKNVHEALSYVDHQAANPKFRCPMIFSELGVLWDWASLEQRPTEN
jgi:hypothetical protein